MVPFYQNKEMNWCRKCSCGKEIVYSSRRSAYISCMHKMENTCRACSPTGIKHRMYGNLCIWNKHPKSDITLKKMSESHLGHNHSEETKRKMSSSQKGNKNGFYGKNHREETILFLKEKSKNRIVSEETREKLRKHRWQQIEKLGVKTSNYNPRACEYIDKLNEEKGWKLQHALNGGEVRVSWYFLDGYDKEKNIVFEYDEIGHNTQKYKQKDLERQKRIVERIKPSLFIRYDEKTNTLYNVET